MSRLLASLFTALVVLASAPSPAAFTDYDGDGKSDVLWRNGATGANHMYLMNGTAISQNIPVTGVSSDWSVAGRGDYNGDSKADILWRHAPTGALWIYLMDANSVAEALFVATINDPDWRVIGEGDYNGDGKADILFRHQTLGTVWLYALNSNSIVLSTGIGVVPDMNWKIVGSGDYDDDGNADILWRNVATGANWLYLMDGSTILTSVGISSTPDLNWAVVGDDDFDGDGKSDILWRNSVTGTNWLYLMDGTSITASSGISVLPDVEWHIVDDGDYNGDGRADVLWRNMVTGSVFMYLMDGLTITTNSQVSVVADSNWQIVDNIALQEPVILSPLPGVIGDGQLQAVVNNAHAPSTTPALGVVVVNQGSFAESAVAGLRAVGSSDAVTVNDRWHIGSLTKSMTGTLTAVLVEQSVISWDTRPADVLTGIANNIHADYANITVADLLSHRAGITADVLGVTNWTEINDTAPGTVVDKRLIWSEDMLSIPAASPVGTYSYSNGGYIIVGAMLEALTGDTWENLITTHVFNPLGMNDTEFGAPGTPGVTDQPWGHLNSGNTPVPRSPGPGSDNVIALGPAGTVHTTFVDYAKYMLAHIDGANGVGSIVPSTAFEYLHTPPAGSSYSIGWIVVEQTGGVGDHLAHDGSNTFWYARVRVMPEIDAAYLIVTNSTISSATAAVNELDSQLTQRLLSSQ